MHTNLRTLLIALLLSLPLGCAQLLPMLPTVITAVQDAILIIDRIEEYVDVWFGAKPDLAAEKPIRAALDKSRVALGIALRSSKGAEAVSEKDVAKAFAEFQGAYAELLTLIKPIGVREASYTSTAEYSTTATSGLTVPSPLAMGIR